MLTLLDVQTPALILDRGKLERNIAGMAARVRDLGVTLRPHLKTPKSIAIARLIAAAGATSFNVSTLREAEYFHAAGFNDLYYCVPFAPYRTMRAAQLIERGCDLKLMTGSLDDARIVIEAAAEAKPTHPLPFTIEIDVDGYRSGAPWRRDGVIATANALNCSSATRFAGIMSHAGASYAMTRSEATALTRRHVEALNSAQRELEAVGLECEMVSFGSTPAVLFAEDVQGTTEARCGIYLFQDLYQAGIGACRIDDIAISVLTSVIGRQPERNRLVIDAGALALSKDRSTSETPFDALFGLVCDAETCEPIDDLAVMAVSQEIGLVSSKSRKSMDYARFPVGRLLRILPNHADMTAAGHDGYVVVNNGLEVEGVWDRINHWALWQTMNHVDNVK